jgi:hypothetical protein
LPNPVDKRGNIRNDLGLEAIVESICREELKGNCRIYTRWCNNEKEGVVSDK